MFVVVVVSKVYTIVLEDKDKKAAYFSASLHRFLRVLESVDSNLLVSVCGCVKHVTSLPKCVALHKQSILVFDCSLQVSA